MPPVILFCGFKPIQDIGNFYRDQALEKGKRLFQNNHVYGVREENGTDIAAKCHSQQGKHVYDVTLQLIQDSRKVVAGSCTCRYGVLGECKHSAAVVHYINTHEVSACTSVPQAWGKPSKRPKLSDKASIGDLFGGNRSNFVGKQEPREVLPRYIIDHFPDIDTPFTDILRLTGQNQVELECAQLLEDVVNDAVTIVRKSEVEVVLQHLTHQASDGEALKYRQDQLTDPEKAFFQKRVASRDVLGICMATMAQSKCAQRCKGDQHREQNRRPLRSRLRSWQWLFSPQPPSSGSSFPWFLEGAHQLPLDHGTGREPLCLSPLRGGTCESRCLESGVSTDPEPCGFARPRLAVRGFPVSGEKGILVVEPSPG
ncbi:uncharacterized protein ISCGN_010100 [Ixodes scapularis]